MSARRSMQPVITTRYQDAMDGRRIKRVKKKSQHRLLHKRDMLQRESAQSTSITPAQWLTAGHHKSLNFHGDLESGRNSDVQFLSHPSLPNPSAHSYTMSPQGAGMHATGEADRLSS